MSAALLAGLLAGYGIAVPVGAIGALLVSLTARTSARVGAAAALGVATADGLYAVIAVLGGTGAARLVAPVAGPLRWAAGLVLAALAVRTAVAALRPTGAAARAGLDSPGRAYAGLLALTLLNPATIVYFAALVLGQRASTVAGLPAGAAFALAAFAASASWQLLLAAGGAALGRVLTGRRGRLATGMVSSGVIGLFAARLLVGG